MLSGLVQCGMISGSIKRLGAGEAIMVDRDASYGIASNAMGRFMKLRIHWFWRSLIAWFAGVVFAVGGFLIYGHAVYRAIGFFGGDFNIGVSIVLVLAHGPVPMLVSIGVYHWLSAPRWDGDHTRCGRCGYILHGLPVPRCSECGVVI